ncbi:lytic transglycosylase domain-containing protein [Actinocorallia sp. A-T 12471]|uniref:lytic transglycosylase domain-containing protein n=1 Tax=Actinocorallia sp. A-T 12471 TaxID=3089813 RepID=UPI0029CD3EF8|nr:lytic murein transglycosylase [Actinocorallia sp. A-T 12471]MDX6739764.1 lytic murein transglycosylase [Actinocorallia sp. A-T 12471]
MRKDRLVTAVASVVVLALTAVAVWAAIRLGDVAEPSRQAMVPPPAITQDPTATAAPVAALERVVVPDVLAVLPTGIDDGRVARISEIAKVADVITVAGGAVTLQGKSVDVLAVDPSRFRSWTPPVTAESQELWTALAGGRFVAASSAAEDLGLSLGATYRFAGREAPEVVLGGTAPLGLPGVDVLVAPEVGARIGLVPSVAVLVNAPGLKPATLVTKVREILGKKAEVVNLHTASQGGTAGNYLDLYKSAATTCPGLSWTVLAAIGQVESDHGVNVGPSSAGALGPMQFMPATWKSYGVDGDGDGAADVMNPFDAIPAAAKYLCASGAQRDLYKAIYAYNHADWYVQEVLALADAYGRQFS